MYFAGITDSRRLNLRNTTAPARPFAVHECGDRVSFSHKNLMKKVFHKFGASSFLQRIYPSFKLQMEHGAIYQKNGEHIVNFVTYQ